MSEESRTAQGDRNRGIRRRDFLALGTATMAAASLPRVALADSSPLGLDLKHAQPLSVGYIVGSDTWVEALDLPWEGTYPPGSDRPEWEIEVVPAASLTVSSELAARDFELTVHGLVPGLPRAGTANWKSVYFFASLPAPPEMIFGPDPVPFLAWSARADGDPRQAAKVRPRLTTGVDGSFFVGVEVRSPAPGPGGGGPRSGRTRKPTGPAFTATVLRSANFTVDEIAERPKLQSGVYLLALAAGLWSQAWSGNPRDFEALPGFESVAIAVRPLD